MGASTGQKGADGVRFGQEGEIECSTWYLVDSRLLFLRHDRIQKGLVKFTLLYIAPFMAPRFFLVLGGSSNVASLALASPAALFNLLSSKQGTRVVT